MTSLPWYSQSEESKPAAVVLPQFEGFIKLEGAQMTAQNFSSLKETKEIEDNVLNFFLEYLRTKEFADNSKEIEILCPSFVRLFTSTESSFQRELIQPLNLITRKLVLAVVYNSAHWSLLVLALSGDATTDTGPTCNFFHADSIENFNHKAARKLALMLKAALKLQNCTFCEMIGPRQKPKLNDCGYVRFKTWVNLNWSRIF